MQYMCLIYAPAGLELSPPRNREKVIRRLRRVHRGSQGERQDGRRRAPSGQPPDTATTVRVREGKRVITDGPYAETKEWLGGFYTFECASLDEALDWAAKIPGAAYGSIEVRPIMVIPAM